MLISTYMFLYVTFLLILHEKLVSANVRWTLHKSEPYTTIDVLKSNAEAYKNDLKFFFSDGNVKQTVAKVDLNVNYYGTIQLGFGSVQRFSVSVDTSFSGLWIPSAACYFSINCKKKNTYNNQASSDYEPDVINNVQQEKTITFGEPNFLGTKNIIYGKLGFDSLTVEDATVPVQHFMEATSMSYTPFYSCTTDGVFGLGPPSHNFKMAPPFYTMLDRGFMDKAVFSIYVGKSKMNGELTFGGWDDDYFSGNTLRYHTMNATSYGWAVTVNSIKMLGDERCTSGCNVLVDTGTALFVVPPSSLKSIYKSLNRQYDGGVVEIPCANLWSLPTLSIRIDGQEFKISAFEYTIKINDYSCVLAMMEGPNETVWIFGNIFLSNFYTIFDVGQKKIAFAELNSINAARMEI